MINDPAFIVYLLNQLGAVVPFGEGGANTSLDLMHEINDEDCKLVIHKGGICRVVSVIRAKVLYKDLILLEYLQVLSDGRERKRDRLHVSEKIYQGEDDLVALKRAFSEELGIKDLLNYVDKGVIKEFDNPHTSYPGLPSEYTFHDFTVTLIDEQFKEEGYEEYDEKTRKRTYFKWIKNTQ